MVAIVTSGLNLEDGTRFTVNEGYESGFCYAASACIRASDGGPSPTTHLFNRSTTAGSSRRARITFTAGEAFRRTHSPTH